MTRPVRVAIGVVESAGQVLVGRRPEHSSLAGHSEFPGGKCESTETTRACVVRECREETGLLVVPRVHLVTTQHQYDFGPLELDFWMCGLSPDLPDLASPRPPFQWVPFADLAHLNFPAANADALDQLGTLLGAE